MLNTEGMRRPGMQQQEVLALEGGGLADCDACRWGPSVLVFEDLIFDRASHPKGKRYCGRGL